MQYSRDESSSVRSGEKGPYWDRREGGSSLGRNTWENNTSSFVHDVESIEYSLNELSDILNRLDQNNDGNDGSESELRRLITETLNKKISELKLKHIGEIKDLKNTHCETLDQILEIICLKEGLLEREVELLIQKIGGVRETDLKDDAAKVLVRAGELGDEGPRGRLAAIVARGVHLAAELAGLNTALDQGEASHLKHLLSVSNERNDTLVRALESLGGRYAVLEASHRELSSHLKASKKDSEARHCEEFASVQTRLEELARLINIELPGAQPETSSAQSIHTLIDSIQLTTELLLGQNKQLDQQVKSIDDVLKQKEVIYQSYQSQISRKMDSCLEEKKKLEIELLRLSDSVPKYLYDELVTRTKELELKISQNKSMQESTFSVKESCETSRADNLPQMSDLSSQFHHLPNQKLKPLLLYWVSQYNDLLKTNKELSSAVLQANDSTFQKNLGIRILEEEVNFLKNNIKILQLKVEDFIAVKNKCSRLESENDFLELKLKYFLNNKSDHVGSHYSVPLEINMTSLDVAQQLSSKTREIILLKECGNRQEKEITKLKNQLFNISEVVNYLKDQVITLSQDLSVRHDELTNLTREKIELAASNRILRIQLQSLSESQECLKNFKSGIGCTKSLEFAERVRADALTILKTCLSTEGDGSCLEEDVPTRDSDLKSHLGSLLEASTSMELEKTNILHKISSLQVVLNSTKSVQTPDRNWLSQLKKTESELLMELESQKSWHTKLNETLSLLLQQKSNQINKNFQDFSSVKEKLLEEQSGTATLKINIEHLKLQLSEKEAILKKTLDSKKELEVKLLEIQKQVASSEVNYKIELMKKRWDCQGLRLKVIQSQIDKESGRMDRITMEGGENALPALDEELHRSVDLQYKQSLQTLYQQLQLEKTRLASSLQQQHTDKVEKLESTIEELTRRIEYLESINMLNHLGIKEFSSDSDLDELKIKLDTLKSELLCMESNEAKDHPVLFKSLKNKFREYFDAQLLYKVKQLQDVHGKNFKITVDALKELHSEEMNLIRLNLQAEKHSEIYNFKQEQQKELKNLANCLTQTTTEQRNSIFLLLRDMIVKELMKHIKGFLFSWRQGVDKKIHVLEEEYQAALSFADGISEKHSAKTEKFIQDTESLYSEKNIVIEKAEEIINCLRNYYDTLMVQLNDFVSQSFCKLKETISSSKSTVSNWEDLDVLKEEIKQLKMEREELEDKHKRVVRLLVEDHKEEVHKVRSLLEQFSVVGQLSLQHPQSLTDLQTQLEIKHSREIEELRTYFEQKCADMEKNFSEEIYSQISRKVSSSSVSSHSSCTDRELESIEVTDFVVFPDADIVLKTDVFTPHKQITVELPDMSEMNFENLEGYFVDEKAKEEAFVKLEELIMNLNMKWKKYCELQQLGMESRHVTKLSEMKEQLKHQLLAERLSQAKLELSVGSVLGEVREAAQDEADWVNALNQHRRCVAELPGREEDSYARENDSEVRWESAFVSQLADISTSAAIQKVKFEEELKQTMRFFQNAMLEKLICLQAKLDSRNTTVLNLTKNVNFLNENWRKVSEDRELASQKEVHDFCCQIDLEPAHNIEQDILTSDIEKLKIEHEKQVQCIEEKYKQELFMKEKKLEACSSRSSEEEMYEKAREHAVNHIVDHIMTLTSDAVGADQIPPEFLALEAMFSSKYKAQLENQRIKYQEELDKIRKLYAEQLHDYKLQFENSEQDCLQNASVFSSDEIDDIIQERNCLKKVTETLKSAVQQLVKYLSDCEDELNRTVVEEVAKGAGRRVHFAPDLASLVHSLEGTSLCEESFKTELEGCLRQLRQEAAAILNITSKQKCIESASRTLWNRAQLLTAEKSFPTEIMSLVEQVALEGDKIIEEMRLENEELQQEVRSADGQLKSTRKFLEEQALERETERDEYSRELEQLRLQAADDSRLLISRQQMDSSTAFQRPRDSPAAATCTQDGSENDHFRALIEGLEQHLERAEARLKLAEEEKRRVETELKETLEKVVHMTETVDHLEGQVILKSEREETLEQRLDELETELEKQSEAQQAMVHEMESLRSRDPEESFQEQLAELQEEIRRQYSSNSVRHIKAQLKEIVANIDGRTKELEGLNLSGSTTSLSSPSEEISIREHLESFRCQTPEFCPSPVALPVDDVNKLFEKIQKLARAEEMVIKKIKDQSLQIRKLTNILGDVQAERDVLQQKVDKGKTQLVEANAKIDDLRRKADAVQVTANKNLVDKVNELEEAIKTVQAELEAARSELQEKEEQLDSARISQQRNTASSASTDLINALRKDLASAMTENENLKKAVEKFKADDPTSLYDCLLEDKNADIQQLQKTISFLEDQLCKSNESQADSSIKGYSITSTISSIHPISPPIMRDAPRLDSSPALDHPKVMSTPKVVLERIPETEEISLESNYLPDQSLVEVSEVRFSSERNDIRKLEEEVNNLKTLVEDLEEAKKDVELRVKTFSEERKLHEAQVKEFCLERQALKDEIAVLLSTIDKKDKEIENTTATVNKLQVIASNVQENLNSAKLASKRAREGEAEVVRLRERCETLEGAINLFYQFRDDLVRIENLDLEFDDENQELSEQLEALVDALQNKPEWEPSQELVRQVEDLKRSNQLLEEKLEREDLTQQFESLRVNSAALAQEMGQLNSGRDLLIRENSELKSERQSSMSRLQEVKTQLQEKIDELTSERSELESIRREFAHLQQENAELMEKLRQLEENKLAAVVEMKSRNVDKPESPSQDVIDERVSSRLAAAVAREMPHSSPNAANLQLQVVDGVSISITPNVVHVPATLCAKDSVVSQAESTLHSSPIRNQSSEPKGPKIPVCDFGAQVDLATQLESPSRSSVSRDPPITTSCEAARLVQEEESRWGEVKERKGQLETRLSELTRVISNQDLRITQLSVDLDEKKNHCLLLELELLKEQGRMKQLECLMETERHKSRTLQRQDAALIESLRIALEKSMKNETSLGRILLEEQQKCESLQACLNSARALEKYISSSNSDSDNEHQKQEMLLRIELDQCKQKNRDLESTVARERNSIASLKEKYRLLEQQKSVTEKELVKLKMNLNQEMHTKEPTIKVKVADTVYNPDDRQTMNNLQSEIKQWKDECLTLRHHIKQRREQEEGLSSIHSPLIKQISDVNKSLESLVREKLCLQAYVNNLEKERDYFKQKLALLQEANEGYQKLLDSCLTANQASSQGQIQANTLYSKLETLVKKCMKAESHRKALVWQKRYLLAGQAGHNALHDNVILSLDPSARVSPPRRRPSFRAVVFAVTAIIKMKYIHKRRKLRFMSSINDIRKELKSPGPSNIAISSGAKKRKENFMKPSSSAKPPSRDQYLPRYLDFDENLAPPEQTVNLRECITMFDNMQRRLGRILKVVNK